MANNGTHKRKETYATEVLEIARLETNIYDDFRTDYEIEEGTGKILVPTREKDVKLTDYDILNGVELSQSGTDFLELPVDQDYAMNELIDGYEASAVPDNIRAQRIDSAGYSTGYKKEDDAIKALEKGTVSVDTETTDETNAYKKILREVKNMKKRGMKPNEMRVAVSADVEEALMLDEKFANTSSTIGAELVREGVIGKISGVYTKPNYLMGDDIEFIIYDKRFCQKYTVWKKEPVIEDIKDDKHIGASHLVGRQAGGIMVTNKLGVQIKKKVAEPEEDPEITEVTVNMTKATATKSEATKGQAIATVSVTGGTQPYSYAIEGTDADKFEMNDTTIQLKEAITEEKEYKATVKVTDSKQKTKTSDEFTFTVSGE